MVSGPQGRIEPYSKYPSIRNLRFGLRMCNFLKCSLLVILGFTSLHSASPIKKNTERTKSTVKWHTHFVRSVTTYKNMDIADQYDVIWLSDWMQYAYPFITHNHPIPKTAVAFYVMSRQKITVEQKNTISLTLADASYSPNTFLAIDPSPHRDFFDASGQLPYHYLLVFEGAVQDLVQPNTKLILTFDRDGTKASVQWKLDKEKKLLPHFAQARKKNVKDALC
jgi:hypothetical protein